MYPVASISAHTASFLDFCRIEKGLAKTSVDAYRLDLERFVSSLEPNSDIRDPAT
jgi:site-specific recombinase XerD